MITRNIALAAVFGLAAEAFLVPSSISLPSFNTGKADIEAARVRDKILEHFERLSVDVIEPVSDIWAGSHTVNLPCGDCVMEDVDSPMERHLKLVFSVSDDRKSLTLNGIPMFPEEPTQRLHASVFGVDGFDIISDDPKPLDYKYEAKKDITDTKHTKMIDLYFQVLGSNARTVDVDGIGIRLVVAESGDLYIGHVKALEMASVDSAYRILSDDDDSHDTPSPGSEDTCLSDSSLAAMLCRLRTGVMFKAYEWHLIQPSTNGQEIPCPGHRMPPGDPYARMPPLRGGPKKFAPYFPKHPHHGQDERQYVHGRFVHAFASALRGFVLGFVVPVMIGVMAGLTASLLGMIVGTAIAWVWMKLVRGGRRGGASRTQEEREARVLAEDEVVVGEKEGLLEHAPSYDDVESPPTYAERE